MRALRNHPVLSSFQRKKKGAWHEFFSSAWQSGQIVSDSKGGSARIRMTKGSRSASARWGRRSCGLSGLSLQGVPPKAIESLFMANPHRKESGTCP